MSGKPIKDLCPSCGSDGGVHNDWFPELGEWDEWPCGSRRGIERHTDQRLTHASKTCQTIRDLKRRVEKLESQVLQPGMVGVDREELAELRGIESCVRAVRNYNGLIGTEERNRLDRLDAIRSAKGEVNG